MRTTTLALAATLGFLATCANAQEPPPAKAAAPAKAAGKALTTESLLELLETLGYEVKDEVKDWNRIESERDSWKTFMYIRVSPDKKSVLFSSPLKNLADPEKMPISSVWKVLEQNDYTGQARFVFHRASKKLYLSMSIDNEHITPAKLRAKIDFFDSQMRGTEKVWGDKNWEAPKADAGIGVKEIAEKQ